MLPLTLQHGPPSQPVTGSWNRCEESRGHCHHRVSSCLSSVPARATSCCSNSRWRHFSAVTIRPLKWPDPLRPCGGPSVSQRWDDIIPQVITERDYHPPPPSTHTLTHSLYLPLCVRSKNKWDEAFGRRFSLSFPCMRDYPHCYVGNLADKRVCC